MKQAAIVERTTVSAAVAGVEWRKRAAAAQAASAGSATVSAALVRPVKLSRPHVISGVVSANAASADDAMVSVATAGVDHGLAMASSACARLPPVTAVEGGARPVVPSGSSALSVASVGVWAGGATANPCSASNRILG